MLSSRLLKVAVLGLSLTSASLFVAGCDRQSADKAQPQAAASGTGGAEALAGTIDRRHVGSPLPDFTFTDPAGKTLRLQSLKGKPLLVNLWATWCAPCVTEMPMLEKLAATRADRLKVLTVSQDLGAPDKVAAFFAARGLKALEPWMDPEGNLPFHYNATTLPTTIFYDAGGREVWRFVGGHDWTNAETAKMLAEGGV